VRKPAGRIAAEQGSLRSAQHLDAVDVERRECQPDHLTHIDVINVDRRGALLVIGEVVLHDAADCEAEGGGPFGCVSTPPASLS